MNGTPMFARLVLPLTLAALMLGGCSGGASNDGSTSNAVPPSSANPASGSGTASPDTAMPGAPTSTGKATVVKAEIVPVNEALPKENKTIPHFQVVWEWKNDGPTPIGTLKGDVRAWDKDGTLTYEAKDQLLFAKYDDEKEALAPGASMKIEKGQGHSMTELKAGDPVRAEVTITYVGPVTKLPG